MSVNGASGDARRAKMCDDKRRYLDKKDALTTRNAILRKRGRHSRAEQLHAYPCPYCSK